MNPSRSDWHTNTTAGSKVSETQITELEEYSKEQGSWCFPLPSSLSNCVGCYQTSNWARSVFHLTDYSHSMLSTFSIWLVRVSSRVLANYPTHLKIFSNKQDCTDHLKSNLPPTVSHTIEILSCIRTIIMKIIWGCFSYCGSHWEVIYNLSNLIGSNRSPYGSGTLLTVYIHF